MGDENSNCRDTLLLNTVAVLPNFDATHGGLFSTESVQLSGPHPGLTTMLCIRWLLAVLRKLIIGLKSLLPSPASIRGLLSLFAAVWRATKKRSPGNTNLTDDSQDTIRDASLQAADYEANGNTVYPTLPTDIGNRVVSFSASSVPASLHSYINTGPNASRSSQDIADHPGTQESYSLHNLSAQHPAAVSVQHLSASAPVHNLDPDVSLPLAVEPSPCLSDAHLRIFPGTPETIGRYTRKATIPTDPTAFSIPPLTMFVRPNTPPDGWTACEHPEGALYFFHEEKRVFTDANIFSTETRVFINDNLRAMNDFIRVHSVHLEPGVDLVLDEYIYSDGSKGCQYYFVNHLGRCVFWMDNTESDVFPVTFEVKCMASASHIRHELEAQYWAFEVTHEIVDELRDIVLHATGDVLTSQTTTISWKIDDLRDMITLIAGSDKNVGINSEKRFSGYNCLVGRLMYLFALSRVYNFHGEPGARLNIDQSIHATVQKRTMLMRLLSPLLFYALHSQLLGLDSVITDGIVHFSGWEPFVKGLHSEWQESIINAAVVLNANVGFLSIQSVDQGGNLVPTCSPAQIASYVSILASIASMIIGLLLVSNHRNRDRDSAAAAATFVFNRTHPKFGLETLAVLMLSFFIAFSSMCFQKTSLPTRTLVAAIWAIVAVLILWCVFYSWESFWEWLHDVVSCLRSSPEEETQDETNMTQQDEARSGVRSESKKWRWVVSWPIITIRKMYDSKRSSITNV
ncbi:hypothetical protein C8R45DRAFT_1113096 [Mycena sanguinolenta]|nr:hypothetical protein C8R45DRAFT_1113096 [Mycena sanguinolenta]